MARVEIARKSVTRRPRGQKDAGVVQDDAPLAGKL